MYHIAQVNVSRLAVPLDDPVLRRFFAYLTTINALAETAPGFVWRFPTGAGDATGMSVFDENGIIVNFSVWTSLDALQNFVYRGDHAHVMRKRHLWFAQMTEQHMALWWIPAGHIPTWAEAQERLAMLRAQGETPLAFTFRNPFPVPAVVNAS